MTTVLGLDVSLTATGWCLLRGESSGITDADIVRYPKGVDGDARLTRLHRSIAALLATPVGLVVMEDLPRGAHGAAATGMAQGVVRLALLDAGVRYELVPPASLKAYAAGRGNATKADLRLALFKRTGCDVPNDNVVDAVWLAAMGSDLLGHPLVRVPEAHRTALGRLGWTA